MVGSKVFWNMQLIRIPRWKHKEDLPWFQIGGIFLMRGWIIHLRPLSSPRHEEGLDQLALHGDRYKPYPVQMRSYMLPGNFFLNEIYVNPTLKSFKAWTVFHRLFSDICEFPPSPPTNKIFGTSQGDGQASSEKWMESWRVHLDLFFFPLSQQRAGLHKAAPSFAVEFPGKQVLQRLQRVPPDAAVALLEGLGLLRIEREREAPIRMKRALAPHHSIWCKEELRYLFFIIKCIEVQIKIEELKWDMPSQHLHKIVPKQPWNDISYCMHFTGMLFNFEFIAMYI